MRDFIKLFSTHHKNERIKKPIGTNLVWMNSRGWCILMPIKIAADSVLAVLENLTSTSFHNVQILVFHWSKKYYLLY